MPTGYITDSSANNNTAHDFATLGTLFHNFPVAKSRLASNGNYPIKIVSLKQGLRAFSGGAKTVTTILGSTASGASNQTGAARGTATFSATTATSYLTSSIDARLSTTPFNMNIRMDSTASIYIRNDPVSGGITIGSSTGRKIWGEYTYLQVPVTPTIGNMSSSQTNQTVTVNWTKITDFGGAITGKGYRAQIATNSSFTTGLQTQDVSDASSSSTFTITGNTGTTTFYGRVYAYNEIKDFNNSPMSQVSTTKSITLAPAAAAPTWSDNMGNTARVGISFSGYATASSTETLTLTNTNDLSDYGLNISKSGDKYTVSGRPTSSGTASLTMTAKDSYDQSTSLTNNISISAPYTPSWPDLTFKTGTANTGYGSDSISASYAESVTASWSDLSPGLSITASGDTVTLSGTPNSNAGGTYYISVEATGYTDGATGSTPTRSATASVYINPLPVPEWTDIAINPIAAINKNYSSNVSATNVESYELIGNPSWLSIGSSTGVLSGFPTSADLTYGLNDAQKSFVVRANGSTEFIEQEFIIDVIHPFKVFKTAEGDFVYPSSQVERYDSILEDFVPVQNIRRRNDANTAWEDIDLL